MNIDPDRLSEFIINHWILCAGLVIIIFLLIQDLWESLFRKYQAVTAAGAVQLMNTRDPIIIDVRETQQHSKSHIQDSLSIPSTKLDKQMYELEAYKDRPIIVVCQTGTQSVSACKKLQSKGFNEVFHLSGGLQAWEDRKLPLSRKKTSKKALKSKQQSSES